MSLVFYDIDIIPNSNTKDISLKQKWLCRTTVFQK